MTVRKRKRKTINTGGFADDFQFDDYGDAEQTDHFDGIKHYLKNTVASTLQDKIDEERQRHDVSKRVSSPLKNTISSFYLLLGCTWWRN